MGFPEGLGLLVSHGRSNVIVSDARFQVCEAQDRPGLSLRNAEGPRLSQLRFLVFLV